MEAQQKLEARQVGRQCLEKRAWHGIQWQIACGVSQACEPAGGTALFRTHVRGLQMHFKCCEYRHQ